MTLLLVAVTGSQLHGLARPDSDLDVRYVSIEPTSSLLALGSGNKGGYSWNGPGEVKPPSSYKDLAKNGLDVQGWELGQFLSLCLKSNPSVLEVLASPVWETRLIGAMGEERAQRLRALLPHIWSSKAAYPAYRGYADSQRARLYRRLPEDNNAALDAHREQFTGAAANMGSAWLRELYQGTQLLLAHRLPVILLDTPIGETVFRWKTEGTSLQEVLEVCTAWEDALSKAYDLGVPKVADVAAVNKFLLEVRRDFW